MMACYGRVSTRRQKADSQKADLQRWLTGHAVPPAAVQWFEDVDSGTTLARPAFDRMQQGIVLGTITTVVVWKLDRISRRQRAGINLLAEWCERGGRVVVITQQLDFSGAGGRLVAGVLFGLAEIEHEYRQERQAPELLWPSGKAAIMAGPRGRRKPSRSVLGCCMTVASLWGRFRRLCRSVGGPSTALWLQRGKRERFTERA